MQLTERVKVYPGHWFGYDFAYIKDLDARAAFSNALKAVPVRAFDMASRYWWVPDIYRPVIEAIALEHRAISKPDLHSVAGFGTSYMAEEQTLDSDFKTLGLQPNAPLRLAEMAAYHWRSTIAVSAPLEAGLKENAWLRIKAHFDAAAKSTPTMPPRLPVMP